MFENYSGSFLPSLFLGCHRALCWPGCQVYVKALNRHVSTQLAGNLRSGCRQCRCVPGIAGDSLPPCLQSNQCALASCTRGGLSGMVLKRLGWYIRSVCDLFFFKVSWYLIAVNLEIVIQVLSRMRWHARGGKKKFFVSKRGWQVDSWSWLMDDLRVREGTFTKKLLKMWSKSN